MANVIIRATEPGDVDAIGTLLAARHRRDRAQLPLLAAALETPEAAAVLAGAALANPRTNGVIAFRDGRPAGFLLGEQALFSPTQLPYLFMPPHSISINVEGHAVADGEDAIALYRDLYAALAEGWTRGGFFTHRWSIPAGDPEVQEAALSLGFGRVHTAATRLTASPVAGRAADVDIHEAGPEDIDAVMQLAEDLNRHHARAPMFWPLLRTTDAAARQFNLDVLEKGETPYFVAYRDRVPVAMQTFLRPGFTPPIVDHSGDVYLFEGVVAPGARSSGLGTAVLAHAMRWAAGAGYRTCTLHFASGNFSGAPFWLGHGFAPIEHGMERRVDERIAWARE